MQLTQSERAGQMWAWGLSLTQARAFLSPFLLQILWVEFWGFLPASFLSERRFHFEALDMTWPGAFPAPAPTTHTHTHLPSPVDNFLLLQNWLACNPQRAASLGSGGLLTPGHVYKKVCGDPTASLRGGGISSLPPSSGPSSLAVGRVPKGLMWGWGGGQWGLDGWLCFFICAIVWTILKLHVKGGISIWCRQKVKS